MSTVGFRDWIIYLLAGAESHSFFSEAYKKSSIMTPKKKKVRSLESQEFWHNFDVLMCDSSNEIVTVKSAYNISYSLLRVDTILVLFFYLCLKTLL